MASADNILRTLCEATSALVERTAAGIVAVHGRQWGTASGIVIAPGVAVTAEEALDKDDEIDLTLADGTRTKATLAGRDPSTDVAVLRFAGGPSAEPPVATAARTGTLVVSVGRTASGPLAALGMISHVGDAWRSQQGGEIEAMIRVNIALSHLAEGGALVDANGQLIGMAVFGPRRRVIAIPTATMLRAADRILAHGSVGRGYIGVELQPVKRDDADGGRAAIVVSLDPDGPAKKAGLLLGDIVTTWNGETISGARGIVNRLGPDSVGKAVDLGLVRAGSAATARLTVAERPPA